MAIRIPIGLPGSGKSYYATRLLVARMLREWRNRGAEARQFVTNLEIKQFEFARYMYAHKCPLGRSHLLQLPKMYRGLRRFWRIRGKRVTPLSVTEEVVDGSTLFQFRRASDWDVGVLYFIDEGHRLFRARDYAKFSGEAQDYLSVHEHLGDELVILTQNVKQMDVSFQRLGEEFIWLVNGCRRRYFGWFRGPKQFLAHSFWHVPEKGDQPDKTDPIKFDMKIANLYRTSEMGDRGENDRQGIHWGWLVPVVCAIPFLFWGGWKLYSYATFGTMERISRQSSKMSTPAVPGSSNMVSMAGPDKNLSAVNVERNFAGPSRANVGLGSYPQKIPAQIVPARPPLEVVEVVKSYWKGSGDTVFVRTNKDVYALKGASVASERILFDGKVYRIGGPWG